MLSFDKIHDYFNIIKTLHSSGVFISGTKNTSIFVAVYAPINDSV